MSKFGDLLKSLREKKGLSRRQLGDASNATERAIRAYEENKRIPSAQVLFGLATALGTDCREFAKCTFEMEQQIISPLNRRKKG